MKRGSLRKWIFSLLAVCVGVPLLLLVVGLIILAHGLPGPWVMSLAQRYISADLDTLTCDTVSYSLLRGITVQNVVFADEDGECLASAERVTLDFRIFSCASLTERLLRLDVAKLYVAQIQYPLSPRTEPFPDPSQVQIPKFRHLRILLTDPDILEIRAERIAGFLTTTEDNKLHFRDLKGRISGREEWAEGDVLIDLHGGTVSSHLRGFANHLRLDGIWHALDFPLLEEYSHNFALEKPTWADASFTVGLDKYRDIFTLHLTLRAPEGTYCGVPFEEGSATIDCKGIWAAHTEISDLRVRRNGSEIATGKLVFDCGEDRFSFEAKSHGFTFDECFRLIDMPFTEAIPKMTSERPPLLRISGSIPLFAEQTPERVVLDGAVRVGSNWNFMGWSVGPSSTTLTMKEGRLSLKDLNLTAPQGGTAKGRVEITIPNSADYTDIVAEMTVKGVPVVDCLDPMNVKVLENCVADGDLYLSCRTDETFKSSVNAVFDLVFSGGLISRIRLFSGLTDLLADVVPGISSLTDSSHLELKGTAQNGEFEIPDFNLTGSLFAIEGPVKYSLVKDHLLADLTVGNFKRDSILGTTTRLLQLPTLGRLLWNVRVSGPISEPKWTIRTFAHRLFGDDSDEE